MESQRKPDARPIGSRTSVADSTILTPYRSVSYFDIMLRRVRRMLVWCLLASLSLGSLAVVSACIWAQLSPGGISVTWPETSAGDDYQSPPRWMIRLVCWPDEDGPHIHVTVYRFMLGDWVHSDSFPQFGFNWRVIAAGLRTNRPGTSCSELPLPEFPAACLEFDVHGCLLLALLCWFPIISYLNGPCRRRRRRKRGQCVACGYSLIGITSCVCPECGATVKR